MTFTPLLGAQIDLTAHAEVTLDVDPSFEHGVLLDQGSVRVGGSALEMADLSYQAPGGHTLHIANSGVVPARMLLLGGPPFGEELVMWWNFVGRSHEEIAEYRELWQADSARFGAVEGYLGLDGRTGQLPAPPLPNSRLKPRRSPQH